MDPSNWGTEKHLVHCTLALRADPRHGGTLGFGMLGFAQQEGKGRGGHAWWMLVAGEGPDEDLARGGADRPVVAARKGRPRERERERGGVGAREEKKNQKEGTG